MVEPVADSTMSNCDSMNSYLITFSFPNNPSGYIILPFPLFKGDMSSFHHLLELHFYTYLGNKLIYHQDFICRIKFLPVTHFWWTLQMLTAKPVYKLYMFFFYLKKDYKHICDTIYTHF